jgi:hypothetical protein
MKAGDKVIVLLWNGREMRGTVSAPGVFQTTSGQRVRVTRDDQQEVVTIEPERVKLQK